MKGLFATRVIFFGILACIFTLPGCSREEQASGSQTVSAQKGIPQQHSGKLYVRILPESPTSADDLQAVFSSQVSVSWRWERNGQPLEDERTPKLSRDRFAKGDTISVVVTSGGQEGKATVTIANSTPEIVSVRLTPDHVCRGVDMTAVPNGADADGDEIRYRCTWKINGEDFSDDDSLVLKGERFKKGDRISAVITPDDGSGTGKAFVTQTVTIPDAAPVFISTPPASFQGRIYPYNAVARDPDGDAVSYSLGNHPNGMTIDGKSGAVRWAVGASETGDHQIEVIAQDSEGAKSFQQFSLRLSEPSGAARYHEKR